MRSRSRRTFLRSMAATAVAAALPNRPSAVGDEAKPTGLEREVGITTSSLSGHLVAQPARGKFTLLELPRIMRDELDMRVIDLNTSALASFEPKYLDEVRKAAEAAGCTLTNLKLNQPGLDMSSPDRAVREQALAEYRRSIDAAARLGLRWARPLPLKVRPDMEIHVASYRALADHAAERKVQLLVENYGWMETEPQSVVKLIAAVDRNVAACPDTGNWADNDSRYQGLAATFPKAVTCDFKARDLGPDGQHPLYDLKRCFTIGWQAGFRGPWCLEHANKDRATLFRELALLRDLLRRWMKEA
jgi:hypothetical protein